MLEATIDNQMFTRSRAPVVCTPQLNALCYVILLFGDSGCGPFGDILFRLTQVSCSRWRDASEATNLSIEEFDMDN